MYIVSHDKKCVFNADLFITITHRSDTVIAFAPSDDESFILGKYKTDERAKEVFEQMLAECFSPLVLIYGSKKLAQDVEDCLITVQTSSEPSVEKFERSVWYMPEE